MPEFDHKAFSKYLTENKLTPFSNINSLIESIDEVGMFHDPVGYKKSETNPKDQIYTKKFKSDGVYDIFKNGEKIKTITGSEGEANAYINKLQRELEEAVPFEKDALDEELTVADINKKYNEMFAQNPSTTFSDVAKALGKTEQEIAAALFKSSMGIKEGEEALNEDLSSALTALIISIIAIPAIPITGALLMGLIDYLFNELPEQRAEAKSLRSYKGPDKQEKVLALAKEIESKLSPGKKKYLKTLVNRIGAAKLEDKAKEYRELDRYAQSQKLDENLTTDIKAALKDLPVPNINDNTEELEEMANFFMVTQDQKDKIDPNKYSGTKKLVAQALKGDEIEVGQPFTKATIKNILGKDPLKDFNAVLDSEEIGGMGKTSDVKPQEPKTPGVRGRKPGEKTEKEPTTKTRTDKVVGVKDIDGPRSADVTAAEKELGGAKGIDRTIAIDKAGKVIIDKLKNSKEQLKDPKFKEAKRLAFIAYLTRPKADGGKIGLRKGGETYTNLLNVWDNTVEDLIS